MDLTAAVSSAAGGATSRSRVAASLGVATTQGITGRATTNVMRWDALQSRDHSAATLWRRALFAKEIMSHSAAGG
jgi:hypothetical protein